MPLPERSQIAHLRSMLESRVTRDTGRGTANSRRQSGPAIMAGIGDDCAVIRFPAGLDSLVTTDFTLENIHFRRDWHPAKAVGHRCLSRGLSDIAAMGGQPVAAFLSLALPRDLSQSWVKAFTSGLVKLAGQHGVVLAGGDTAESPNGILADIIVLGAIPKGQAILRSSARVGDRIFVSGRLGGSAAALVELRGRPPKKSDPRSYPRHFYPEPRIELGRILRQRGIATAMIDTSDGLSTDLSHICEESGVGAEMDATRIPRARIGKPAREVAFDMALHGGEDYELLFTVGPGKAVPQQLAGVALTEIGRIVNGHKIRLLDDRGGSSELKPRGWEHFNG
jgi:thiamine-monophosphate kinase